MQRTSPLPITAAHQHLKRNKATALEDKTHSPLFQGANIIIYGRVNTGCRCCRIGLVIPTRETELCEFDFYIQLHEFTTAHSSNNPAPPQ